MLLILSKNKVITSTLLVTNYKSHEIINSYEEKQIAIFKRNNVQID